MYRAVYRGSVVAAKVVQVGEESKSVIGEVEKCRLAGMVSSTMYILCFKLVIIIVTWLLQANSTPQYHPSDGIPHNHGQLMIIMPLVDGENLHDTVFDGKHQVYSVSY